MVTLKTLKNGTRVIMEPMDSLRSVTLGIWVNAGTVRETKEEAGASHFIEHMLFKGTKKRTALQISSEMDNIGGMLNAFTSRECTCFYAKVLDEHLPIAVDLLSDIVLNSTFDPKEMDKERHVVVEEILMNEDSPEDLSSDKACALFYDGDPVMYPILGTQESILNMTRDTLVSYKERFYIPENIVISCAGSFSEDRLIGLLENSFVRDFDGKVQEPFKEQFRGGRRFELVEKDIEQANVTMMLPGYRRGTQELYALSILSNVIGGNMSSRLFQKIREERGLAYSVYSFPMPFVDSGAFVMYAGTGEKQASEVIRLMLEEMENIRKNGITEEEFSRGREQLKGNFVLGMESSNSHMNALGKNALLLNRKYDESEELAAISSVRMEDIDRIIPEVCNLDNLCGAVVGRVGGQKQAIEDAFASVR